MGGSNRESDDSATAGDPYTPGAAKRDDCVEGPLGGGIKFLDRPGVPAVD